MHLMVEELGPNSQAFQKSKAFNVDGSEGACFELSSDPLLSLGTTDHILVVGNMVSTWKFLVNIAAEKA